jgi:hypothetical protein
MSMVVKAWRTASSVWRMVSCNWADVISVVARAVAMRLSRLLPRSKRRDAWTE